MLRFGCFKVVPYVKFHGDFSYIMQMMRTTKFVVMRTFRARKSVTLPFNHWIPPICHEFAHPQSQITKYQDPNLFAGHLEYQSFKQKAFVRKRADHADDATLHSLSHIRTPLPYHSFHNKESWRWYVSIVPLTFSSIVTTSICYHILSPHVVFRTFVSCQNLYHVYWPFWMPLQFLCAPHIWGFMLCHHTIWHALSGPFLELCTISQQCHLWYGMNTVWNIYRSSKADQNVMKGARMAIIGDHVHSEPVSKPVIDFTTPSSGK